MFRPAAYFLKICRFRHPSPVLCAMATLGLFGICRSSAFAPQLADKLAYLSNARRSQGMPPGYQAAVGIDRYLPIYLCFAFQEPFAALAFLAEAERFDADCAATGERGMALDHLDIFRPYAALFVGLLAHPAGQVAALEIAADVRAGTAQQVVVIRAPGNSSRRQ